MEQPRVGTHYPRSTGEFQAWFRTDADCLDYLDWVRWPGGFTCPSCGHAGGWRLGDGRYECAGCHGRTSVTAGTIFDRTRTPLTVWFTACWLFATQKDGVSAQSLQRSLEIGSYPTAWAMLHRLRSVLVRPGRDRLSGTVEVDETFIGGPEPGLSGGRAKGKKVLTGIAVEVGGPREIGRCRMAVLADASAESLNPFITGAVEPGSTVITDAWQGYSGLPSLGYTRERRSQRAARARGEDPGELLPNVHRVAGLAKRWLLGTHQGSVDGAHLPAYLNEFVFRFNRRRSRSRGLVFYRVLELAAGHDPVRFRDLLAGKKPRPAPATWGLGHPPTLERPAANRPWRTGDLQLQLPIPLRLSKYPRRSVITSHGHNFRTGRPTPSCVSTVAAATCGPAMSITLRRRMSPLTSRSSRSCSRPVCWKQAIFVPAWLAGPRQVPSMCLDRRPRHCTAQYGTTRHETPCDRGHTDALTKWLGKPSDSRQTRRSRLYKMG